MARKDWTDDDKRLLRRWYPHLPTADVAHILRRSLSATYAMAKYMGVTKSPAYLASPAACRLRRGDNVGTKTRFGKGQLPWNKGMVGLAIGGRETQFKKGHRGGRAQQLYKPVGTERLSKEGYLERKINDDMPLQRRWRAVHLIEWEAVNGPLPTGHALTFKDGDKTHHALDNLELITRAELMRRNSCHQYGPEIAQLVQLRGAVSRRINHRRAKA